MRLPERRRPRRSRAATCGSRVRPLDAPRQNCRARRRRRPAPTARVAALVADVRDAPAVRRPARVAAIELAEGQRQRRGAVRRGQPELVPLPAVVAAVEQDALPRVPTPGARSRSSPRCSTLRAASGSIAPARPSRSARAPGHFAIADEEDGVPSGVQDGLTRDRTPSSSSGRSRSCASPSNGRAPSQSRCVEVGDVEVEVPGARGGHPGELPAVRRDAAARVFTRALGRQRLFAPAREVAAATARWRGRRSARTRRDRPSRATSGW